MAKGDVVFAGSVPEIYDRLLVPLIFDSYAADLTSRLAAFRPRDVLELAAGTGVLTRAMAAALSRARIVATDLNQPMLDQAMARQSDAGRVVWQQADAQALPFDEARFGAAVCQFGVMFLPGKPSAYRGVHRVLRSSGVFIFNVWDRIGENEFASVAAQALAAIFSDDPPNFMARIPHGYHDVAKIGEDLRAAGFTDMTIDTVAQRSRAATANDVAVAYCQGTPWRNEIVARDPARLSEATQVVADAIAQRFGAGPVEGRIRAHVATARA